MSRLDELIAELCPDGVEYKRIDEICVVQNGYTPSKKNNEFWEDGDIPWFRMEDIRQNGRELEDAVQHITTLGVRGSVFPANSLIFATTATVGEHALIKVPFVCNQQLTHIHINDDYTDAIEIRYLFHYAFKIDEMCKNSTKGGSTLPAVDLNKFRSFKVAVPPLEVQREIVHILDRFTLLTAELTAELTARKKQYEYYRDTLLNNNTNTEVEKATLGEISEFVTVGIANSATHSYRDNGVIMFRNQNIEENHLDDSDLIYIDDKFSLKYKNKILKENDILVTRTGYPGKACVVPQKYEGAQTFTTLIVRLKSFTKTNPKYVCYYINSISGKKYVQKMQSGAAQQNFGAMALSNMPIPIPNIDIQKKMVNVLDNF